MSNQPRYSNQYYRNHRNEDNAVHRASKQIPRGFQHVPFSPEAAPRPKSPDSDYDTPPYRADDSSPSDYDHYRNRPMAKYQPQSPALQYRNRSPDVDSDYIAPPGPPSDDDDYIEQPKSTQGVFSDETANYSNREFSKSRSPDLYSTSRDHNSNRFIDDTPPHKTRTEYRNIKNRVGWDSKPDVIRSRGLKPGKYEDYQEAKEFLERFHEFEAQQAKRRNNPHHARHDYRPKRYRDDRSRITPHYNYSDYQEAKQFLERYQKLEAQRAKRTQLEYRRDEEYSPIRYRGGDSNTSRRHWNNDPSPTRYNSEDYHEAKDFLERYCELNAQHARRYNAAHHRNDNAYPPLRYRDDDEDEDTWPRYRDKDDSDHPPTRYRDASPSPIRYRNADHSPRRIPARQPSPQNNQMPGSFSFEEPNPYPAPSSDTASHHSDSHVSRTASPLLPTAPFPPAPSIPGSDICSVASRHNHGSAYASSDDEQSIQGSDYASFPISRPHSPTRSIASASTSSHARNRRRRIGAYESDDNGIAEGSDYLPSDSDDGDGRINGDGDGGAHTHFSVDDGNGVAEGSDYLPSDDDDAGRRSGRGSRHCSRPASDVGSEDEYDDEGDYMSSDGEDRTGGVRERMRERAQGMSMGMGTGMAMAGAWVS
ncbi:hypothetical protein GMOD_00005166 [Pyrenophora seminiperda CCB06]|uniref:Uncharacterized protein n=1 Tax=Pyrenophora seminiperda CCB06 TaxID=1302712 RepID=A0A3M7LV45_9PLEO|nr:hypothetical protein GMOD_00005166 [Pyrenophora seminiperda CCB06]